MNKKVTLRYRLSQYPDDFEEVKEEFSCKFCKDIVKWEKEDTIKKHLKSTKHQKAKFGPIQLSLEEVKSVASISHPIVLDFVNMLISADIPMQKVDKMKPFLTKYCVDGGKVPSAENIRKLHINRYFDLVYQQIKEKIKNKKLVLIYDCSTDFSGKPILNVLCKLTASNETLMLDSAFISCTKAREICDAIMLCIRKYEINIQNVDAVVSDSCNTMIKVYQILSEHHKELLHFRCIIHLLNLILEINTNNPVFEVIHKVISKFQYILNASNTRKNRYHEYLKSHSESLHCTMPKCALSRWVTWYEAAFYLKNYLDLPSFLEITIIKLSLFRIF